MSVYSIIISIVMLLTTIAGDIGAPGLVDSLCDPGDLFTVSRLTESDRRRIDGESWKPGCPVPIEDLRFIKVAYVDFGGRVKAGEIICHYTVADDLADIFREIYESRFPIERIKIVDEYGADDALSMEDNNSSAFNFRFISGTNNLSRHAYGLAIDINPIQNPYVEESAGVVMPEAGRAYVDRSDIRPGMITPGDAVHKAFTSRGWKWGGDWKYQIDYQHFQK